MDYADSEVATEVGERTRRFVDEVVLPVEREHAGGTVPAAVVEDLRERAREREVYGPHLPAAYGGLALDFRDAVPAYEAASRSILGQHATRIDAPDEGNMHLLELVATDDQQERWLRPLAEGELRSGFAMTEPAPGAGDDPTLVRTRADRDGDEWVLDGHKWWVTQGCRADLLIVMARTDQDAHPYQGCSLFVVPADAEGVEVVRDVPHLGEDLYGMDFAEIVFDGVRVPEGNVLGEVDGGFVAAQKQLGFTRLTHCMRYGGMAERALDVAKAYLSEREAFGSPLSEKQAPRFDVARGEMQLHAARTMVRHAAGRLGAGEESRAEISMCKVFAANVVQEVVDTAVQLCGGNGIGKDLPLADFYESVRHFRILDGSDEVHLRTIARDAFEDVDEAELEPMTRYRG